MGSRAFSHDSIFIPDGRTESEQAIQAMSQENVLGKVKTLQQQLAKNIKFGQPPQMTVSARTMGEANTSAEEDVLFSSSMEAETQQDTVISESGNKSSDSLDFLRTMNLPGTGHEVEEKVIPVKSARPKRQFSYSGTIETINLDSVPQAVARLDNSAAKHKMSVKPKKQRMSRKHKRLTKGSQSLTITEFEPDDLETPLFGDIYPGYNGHFTADSLIQDRDEQKQLQMAEEQSIEDHLGILEAERIRQIMQKEQEKRQEEERRQHLLEGETSLKTEEQTCHKEERRLMEAEKRQDLEEQKYQELEKQRQKELEEQQRRELEVQKLKEQEEQQRQELEEKTGTEREEQQRKELEEEQTHQELEEQKHQEWEEQKHKELEEKKRRELEEQKGLALEELRPHRIEKECQEEEERTRLEKQKGLKDQNKGEIQRQELEEKELQEIKQKKEKEPDSLKQEKKQEEQRQHLKEKGEKTEKEQSQQVMDKKKKREDQRKHKLTKQMHMESSEGVPQDEPKEQKEQNRQEWNKLKEQKADTQGQNLQQNQEKSLEQSQNKDELCSGGADRHPVEEKLQGSRVQKLKQPEKGTRTAEEMLAQKLKREVEAQEQKRIGEELRWQEVDERQTASRPFTFQVSSGDKQIIFQKVNLSPVMPVKGAGLSSSKDCRMHTTSQGSHTLPSSVCVPHTAILVTGAQLCGTAVDLNQIKDTACKSLLGLTEERKNVDIPSPEKSQKKKHDPKPSSSKMKHAQETLNNQAVLAEWASIRSRILKNAENNKYNETDQVSVCRHSDDWTPRGRGTPHGNLRKTLSANAKFSITPAWQKFSDVSRTSSDAENVNVAKGNETVAMGRTTGSAADSKESVASALKDNLAEKAKEKMETHSEVTDNTEGCKFAKDLPSFLVPSFSHPTGKELPQSELPSALENQQNNSTKKADKPSPNGEENVSPFGIKLRRTNYSLRFHYDQQAEQRKKKRYSAGDSFDGVPDPLPSTEGEKESPVFAPQENTSPGVGRANVPGNTKDSSVTVVEFTQPVAPAAFGQSAFPPACKSLVPQKPALAPKPTSQTPPSSPLSKMNRSNLSETLGQRVAKAESDSGWRKEDRANAAHPTPSNEYKNEEEEIKEKKSFFPSLSIPWREKNDKKPEPLKKEKPVLQSRHSLDGSKLMEKVETSQPLWITLALQKQKGFREQQATREERRQAREAKQAERLAKEMAALNNQSDNKSSSSSKTNTLPKSSTQEGEKKIETTVSRLERREQLKKSNTLPTSVTVEISDSVPSTPVTKEVAKRFSTPDANPVSTEPAWLALAKRKAKAWSDCPQIIK
ncbi:PREDICTED: uncharacterized protein KIAA1211 homolog [Acanthisitta chloris]|uniref:uncharacterized protein KIAA1211 homolog n=1 Tax=Acanthisitta chloris TaxID=57068 RepID=UPI0004F0CF31|nr:PREDICTED: uncharacterized protein KIAA1211 homolog [Acanthisitta chloris]